MPIPLRSLLAAALLASASLALAQAAPASAAVQAVVGYMNLIDPDLVQQIEEDEPSWTELQVARELIASLAAPRRDLEQPGVIEPMVATAMRRGLDDGCLSLPLLEVFLIDVVNGVIEELRDTLLRYEATSVSDVALDPILRSVEERPIQVNAMLRDRLPGVLFPATAVGACVDGVAVAAAVLASLRDFDLVAAVRDRYARAISPVARDTLTRPRGN